MQNLAAIPGRQAQARQADGGSLSDDMVQKWINREDEPGYGPHDREYIFPGEDNSSYRYMKSSRKKGLRENLADNGTFFALRATRGRGFA
jgi:hypothetical protein